MDDYSKYANLPIGTPPPGVVANFDNPPSRAHELYIGMGICITVAAVLLALRMYAKVVVTHTSGWDDSEIHHMILTQTLTVIVACSIGFVRDASLPACSWYLRLDTGNLCRPNCRDIHQ